MGNFIHMNKFKGCKTISNVLVENGRQSAVLPAAQVSCGLSGPSPPVPSKFNVVRFTPAVTLKKNVPLYLL